MIQALKALGEHFGHCAVLTTDAPGFLVNHAGRGFVTEAGRIVSEGIGDFIDIDRIMVDGASFRMGPFRLLDLTGLDVSHRVMESIYEQYYQEPRVRPNAMTRLRLEGGLLGRKTGRGFYQYDQGKARVVEEPSPVAVDPAAYPVWVSHQNSQSREELVAVLEAAGAQLETDQSPSAEALCLITPLAVDATHGALVEGLDPERTLAVDTWFSLSGRLTLMRNPVTLPAYQKQAQGLLAANGRRVTLINDSPGFVAPRIVAMIVNIGCEIAQQRIAVPADIDKAVTIGLGYPEGPLAWGDQLGPQRVLALLESLYQFYGDPRYRPSPWLQRRARLGVSLLTPD